MNWDMIINVGMFGLGCCFVLVAIALLLFGNFDDEEKEMEYYPPELFEDDVEVVKRPDGNDFYPFDAIAFLNDEAYEEGRITKDEYDDNCLEIASMAIASATSELQEIIDKDAE